MLTWSMVSVWYRVVCQDLVLYVWVWFSLASLCCGIRRSVSIKMWDGTKRVGHWIEVRARRIQWSRLIHSRPPLATLPTSTNKGGRLLSAHGRFKSSSSSTLVSLVFVGNIAIKQLGMQKWGRLTELTFEWFDPPSDSDFTSCHILAILERSWERR